MKVHLNPYVLLLSIFFEVVLKAMHLLMAELGTDVVHFPNVNVHDVVCVYRTE